MSRTLFTTRIAAASSPTGTDSANASHSRCSVCTKYEPTTATGATAAGSVRGRAATSHSRSGVRSGALREPGEVGLALLLVGVTSLLGLLRHVEEEVGVVRELLDAREAVLGGVEAGLQEAQ